MARIYGDLKQALCVYDFAVDGGAASTIGLGVFIPNNAVFNSFFVKTVTAPTSGGAATISFGYTGDTDAFMIVRAYGDFVLGECLQGVDFGANPLEASAARQLAITIATAALTAGKIVACLAYTEMDL